MGIFIDMLSSIAALGIVIIVYFCSVELIGCYALLRALKKKPIFLALPFAIVALTAIFMVITLGITVIDNHMDLFKYSYFAWVLWYQLSVMSNIVWFIMMAVWFFVLPILSIGVFFIERINKEMRRKNKLKWLFIPLLPISIASLVTAYFHIFSMLNLYII